AILPALPPRGNGIPRFRAGPHPGRLSAWLERRPKCYNPTRCPARGETPMFTVAEAQAVVLRNARVLSPATRPLTPAALGAVLAEDVASDLDMPPYDKAMMDGYAVRCADLPDGRGTLTVI